MKLWNFGSSQSIGYDHDAEFVSCPSPIKATAFPYLLKSEYNLELINYGAPGFNYERIYQGLLSHLNHIQADDVVMLQINTGITMPLYFTPDGKAHQFYSPKSVELTDKRYRAQAIDYYLNHHNETGDFYKLMSQTNLILKLLIEKKTKLICFTCDYHIPTTIPDSNLNAYVSVKEQYLSLLEQVGALDLRTFADDVGFVRTGRHYDEMVHYKFAQHIREKFNAFFEK
jgi:hypothetical protein